MLRGNLPLSGPLEDSSFDEVDPGMSPTSRWQHIFSPSSMRTIAKQACPAIINVRWKAPFTEGGQGSIYMAEIVISTVEGGQQYYSCIIKEHTGDETKSKEFNIQELINNNMGDVKTPKYLLRLISSFSEEEGEFVTHYGILPRCDFTLRNLVGPLRQLEKNVNKTNLYHKVLIEVMQSLLRGMLQLIELRVVHLDIKMENIGRYGKLFCYLDFGVARTYENIPANEAVGTLMYIAPESLFKENHPPYKRDIFSLGQVFLELAGKEVRYKDLLSKEEPKNLVAWIYNLGNRYRDEQKQFRDFDEQKYQESLTQQYKKSTNVVELLEIMGNSMVNLLPDHRPNKEAIEAAILKLDEFSVECDQLELLKFWLSISNAGFQSWNPATNQIVHPHSCSELNELEFTAPPAGNPSFKNEKRSRENETLKTKRFFDRTKIYPQIEGDFILPKEGEDFAIPDSEETLCKSSSHLSF